MRLATLPARLIETSRVLRDWCLQELSGVGFRRRRRIAGTGNHLMMLADQMPPIVSGGTYRPLSFAVGAQSNGWTMTVFTASGRLPTTQVGAELERTIPPDVDVFRVADAGLSLPLLERWEIDGGFRNALELAKTVRETCANPPGIILATGPRFHGFVAGFFLKKAFGSKLVLDYRDEWSECPFHFVRKGPTNRWWERRCIAASDLVIFTTPAMMAHALRSFPELVRERCVVIENGVTADELAVGDQELFPASPKDDCRTIAFMGNLSGHTDPAGFMATLSRVIERRPEIAECWRLLWVGTVRQRQREVLERMDETKMSRIIPQVSPRDAQAMMRRSSLLLLLTDRDMDRYRPGKLYSYLASNTPILLYGSRGESGRIIEELSAGFVVDYGDDRALEAALDSVFRGLGQRSDEPKREAWVREHQREVLAKRLFQQLDDLLGRPPSDHAQSQPHYSARGNCTGDLATGEQAAAIRGTTLDSARRPHANVHGQLLASEVGDASEVVVRRDRVPNHELLQGVPDAGNVNR